MTAADQTGPITASERSVTLDIVRGFALLGIFIMNMPGFSTSFFAEADGSRLWTDPLNKNAEIVRDMLFSGKFNSMFSLLFGIGFTIQFTRLSARDAVGATQLYVRRLLTLMAIAVVHACVFWSGDVLHIYAVLGFGLLLLRNASDRWVIGLIIATLLWPPVSGTLRIVFMNPDVVARMVADAKVWEASNNLAYGSGSFIAAVQLGRAQPRIRALLRRPVARLACLWLLGPDDHHDVDRISDRPRRLDAPDCGIDARHQAPAMVAVGCRDCLLADLRHRR